MSLVLKHLLVKRRRGTIAHVRLQQTRRRLLKQVAHACRPRGLGRGCHESAVPLLFFSTRPGKQEDMLYVPSDRRLCSSGNRCWTRLHVRVQEVALNSPERVTLGEFARDPVVRVGRGTLGDFDANRIFLAPEAFFDKVGGQQADLASAEVVVLLSDEADGGGNGFV